MVTYLILAATAVIVIMLWLLHRSITSTKRKSMIKAARERTVARKQSERDYHNALAVETARRYAQPIMYDTTPAGLEVEHLTEEQTTAINLIFEGFVPEIKHQKVYDITEDVHSRASLPISQRVHDASNSIWADERHWVKTAPSTLGAL